MNITPSRQDFLARPQPLVLSMPLPDTDAFELYRKLVVSRLPSFLLDGGGPLAATGRYSFLGTNPYMIFRGTGTAYEIEYPATGRIDRHEGDSWVALVARFRRSQVPRSAHLPPFFGGAVGFLGYDVAQRFEPVRFQAIDDTGHPELVFLFVEQVVAVDHERRLLQIVFSPPAERLEQEPAEKLYREGRDRLLEWQARLLSPLPPLPPFTMPDLRIEPDQSPSAYTERVRACQALIKAGDIYQANLSHRFTVQWPAGIEPAPSHQRVLALYKRMRAVNPSPFSALVDLGSLRLLSGSPERLVRLDGRQAETRPIAGTRPRGRTSEEDQQLIADLLASEKERAEHLMLVDLARNDLGRVCRYGTVQVDRFMTVESYSHVNHIVSNVTGELHPRLDGFDLLQAMFPGGTITGVPKIRCMEIIDALEPVRRGPYTGSLGYVSWSGDLDFNILIRTLVLLGTRWHLQVGAGIVADSNPDLEYEETLHKAQAALQALRP